MFSQRQIQLFFLTLAVGISLFFAFRSLFSLNDYFNLRVQTPAKVSQWEIEEIGNRWAVRAIYSAEYQGKVWSGATLLKDHLYLNEEIAFRALQDLSKKNWSAWINPSNPANSSLERTFPLNLLIRTLVSFAVLIYFYIFRRWINNKFLNC